MEGLSELLCLSLCFMMVVALVVAVVAVGVVLLQRSRKQKPTAPPSPVDQRLSPSIEQVAKYTQFVMTINDARNGCYTQSVQSIILWAANWMVPEWQIQIDREQQGEPLITVQMQQGTEYQTVYSGNLADIESEFAPSMLVQRLNKGQKKQVTDRIHELAKWLKEEAPFPEADVGSRDADRSVTTKLLVDGYFDQRWKEDGDSGFRGLEKGEVRLLAKYLLFAKQLELARTGRLRMSVNRLVQYSAPIWLIPDLQIEFGRDDFGSLLVLDPRDEEPVPIARSYVDCFPANVPIGGRLAGLGDLQRQHIADLARDFGLAILPSQFGDALEDDELAWLAEVLSQEGVTSVLSVQVPAKRGIRFIDMGLATRWQAVQVCKGALCTLLSNSILSGEIEVSGVTRDNRAIARWGATWLQPHWDLVILRDKQELGLVGDSVVELYPMIEGTGMRDALYFRGSYAELVYTSQPILKDLERLDRSGVVGDLVMKLLKPYGEDIERDTVLGNLADIQLSMILERYNEVIPDRVNQLPGFWPTYLAEQETT